jgi:hypothetical protein
VGNLVSDQPIAGTRTRGVLFPAKINILAQCDRTRIKVIGDFGGDLARMHANPAEAKAEASLEAGTKPCGEWLA